MESPESERLALERMAFAVNALPAPMAYLDATARHVWMNDGYLRWLGRQRDEIIGRHPSEVHDAATWAAIRPHVERALAGEEAAFDSAAMSSGGDPHDVRARYVPHRDDAGRVRGFVVLVTDITELKAANSALRWSERMLEQSQSAAQLGSWEVTLDEGFSEVPMTSLWSSGTYRILGYEPGTPASKALFYRRVHPDDAADLHVRSARALALAQPFETEYRIVRPDGNVRVIRAWLDYERQAGGKSTRVFGTLQDITERRRATQEVRGAREQLQLVVDTTPAFIGRCDRDRRLVWANKSYASRFGKAPDELVGCQLSDLVGEAAFRVIDPYCQRVLSGESLQVELEIPYAYGLQVVHLAAAPTLDAAGVPDGWVAVLTDVTRWHRLERERERALDDLRDADRRKDEFLAMLSHELRNPLGAIVIAVEVLAQLQTDAGDLAAEYRGIIARQAGQMKRLLDDLLDVSRVSQGKIELHKERVDLDLLLRRALEASRPMIVDKRQTLSLALSKRPLVVEADPARLIQVFDNLINNAAKYTDTDGHITITSIAEDHEAVVTVQDDGVGMAPDLLARAFDMFVQGTRSLDRKQGGLGIGLTLVRTLVNMHGGSVAARSEGPGRGSELVVRLPLCAPLELALSERAPQLPERRIRPLRVLVVDDNVDAATGMGHLLGLLGHQVVVKHDGPTALVAAGGAPPDLVLLDIGLPGMDGYAVAAQLRAAGHTRATLVAVTGYGQEEDSRSARAAGFDGHLAKPVDFAQLKKLSAEVAGRAPVET
ncbi:MAG TPA: PAS domain-containing protein [Polyangia bacterium]|nr:PAS domain-containing protein [Polyangia bacterium]